MLLDLHVHGMAHGQFPYSEKHLCEYLSWAQKRGIGIVGFAEHNWFLDEIDFELVRRLARVSSLDDVLVGLEVDHQPDRVVDIRDKVTGMGFDYLIGSVHELDGWAFDHPDYAGGFETRDIDRLYEDYFEVVKDLILSRIYDIVGHLDLIKINGYRPQRNIRELVEPVLQLVRETGMAVEVNTSGAYKPVEEIYPGPEILKLCREMQIPITIGSDAHLAEHTGRDIKKTTKMLSGLGFKEVVSFKKRKPILHSLLPI